MSTVLFCPFCRESFEGLTACPEHDLSLVPWHALRRSERSDDAPLPALSPAKGRGLVGVGALGTLLCFGLGSLASTEGALRMGGSMLKLALFGSPKLWLVAAGGVAQLAVLARRRSPRDLRGARLAVLIMALAPPLAGAWALRAAQLAAERLALREGAPIELRLDAGGFGLLVFAVLSVAGALRLGGPDPRGGRGGRGGRASDGGSGDSGTHTREPTPASGAL